jgi:uncharacterized repeat protein (TIGR01451 family)
MKTLRLQFFSLSLVLWVASSAALAQVCATPGLAGPTTTLAGTVNSYYPGSGNVTAGATSITLGALDTSGGGSATTIGTGDLLIVMQMQGATFDFSNSDCYGDGVGTAGCATRATTSSSYAGGHLAGATYLAGNWEYCTAVSALGAGGGALAVNCSGGSGGTVNAYQQSAATGSAGAYRYQVIRVPQHSSATLSGAVTAAAWNGSTGGVVALQVAGALNMNGASINASSRGFRGGGVTFVAPYGPPVIDPTNGSSFYRAVAGAIPGGEREGSFKGEGIAGTPRLVYNGAAQVDTGTDGYPGGSRGRGAPGNAGGGGNNQNGGGAGGGNGGLGGNGGGGWNDVSRPNTFFDSGGHGGDGSTRGGNNLGLSVSRMIMGGGGGAGHVDGGGTSCEQGGWGGNGGGIAIVKAGSFAGAGSIVADGNTGFLPNFTGGGCTDAAGGGGAGGSIYVVSDTGSLAGLTINARGGTGVNSSHAQHGPGGGGGGGAVRYTTPGGAPAIAVTGGTNGRDANGINQAGYPATPQAWFSTAGANSSIASSAATVTHVYPPPAACFPAITVTKSTTTPNITAATGAVAQYSISAVNTAGGAAIGSALVDNALPPGWTAAAITSVVFSPALSATVRGGFVESATPGVPAVAGAPGGIANMGALGTAPSSTSAPFLRSLTIPGNGSVTVTYTVSIPDTATAGTYHNAAGVRFLDPTRSAVSATRVVSPATNNTANRCSVGSTTGCSASGNTVGANANTAFTSGAAVAGSNYSGLEAGGTGENVTLQPDLSVDKTSNMATTVAGTTTMHYVLTARNNGRPVANQVFNTTQATGQSATAIVSSPIAVTDTLPAGVSLTAVATSNGAIWACTNATSSTFTCSSSVATPYPLAAASTIVTITATVTVSATGCPGPLVNTATISIAAIGDANTANNTGTTQTAIVCAGLTVTKTDGATSVAAGGSTIYTLTFNNAGPSNASGAIVRDVPGAGLNCTAVGCSSTGGTCPAVPANILTGGGVALPSFPSGATTSFTVTCGITATGQ